MSMKLTPFVQKMAEGLPDDLKDLFIPKTEDDLLQLECQLVKLSKKEDVRAQVMRLQRKFGLPLRPNMSLNDVGIRIRVALLRKINSDKRQLNEIE